MNLTLFVFVLVYYTNLGMEKITCFLKKYLEKVYSF